MTSDTRKRQTRIIFVFISLTALLFVLVVLNISIGSFMMSPKAVWQTLSRSGGETVNDQIIWLIRMPRLIAGLILGRRISFIRFFTSNFFQQSDCRTVCAGHFVRCQIGGRHCDGHDV